MNYLVTIILFISGFLLPHLVSSQQYTMSDTTITTCSGTFYDSGGDAVNYSNNENFVLTFYSDNGNRLCFNFQSYDTESCCDYLEIYDGNSTAYPLIGRFLGSNSPGIITSAGSSLTFKFYSNGSVNAGGWAASISCSGAPLPAYNMTSGTISICSAVFYDNGGPTGNYPDNENRIMTFCSGDNSFIKIRFTDFDLSPEDSLWVYDGTFAISNLIAVLTGSAIPEEISSITGSCLIFWFKSNSATNLSGWQGILSCDSTPVINTIFNMSGGTQYTCNATFYDSGGETGDYSSVEDKIMSFHSTSGCPISANFTTFSTGSGADKLYIYDGPGITSPSLGFYSLNNVPPAITSTGSSLTFKFHSGNSSSGTGWAATLSCSMADITASPGLTACQGDTISLTASAGVSYNWSNGASTQQINVVNPGIYGLTVTDSNGCNLVSLPAYITINPKPNAVISSGGSTVFCQGDSVVLSASGETNYLWNDGWNGQFNTIFQSGNYFASVTNSYGCTSITDTIPVNVLQIPSAPATIYGDTAICYDQANISFYVNDVPEASSYIWDIPPGVFITSGNFTDSIVVIWGTISGNICVTAFNSNCSSTQTCKMVNAITTPAIPGSINGPAEVCQEELNISYSIPPVATTVNYNWTVPAGSSVSSGDSTTSITVNFGTLSGNICVNAGNICGTGNNKCMAVILIPVPETPVITLQDYNILSSSAATGNQWYDSNGTISGATFQTFTAPSTGYYFVIVTQNACSSDTSNIIYADLTDIDKTESTELLIYPNPVKNKMIIEILNPHPSYYRTGSGFSLLNSKFEILNVIGQVIYSSVICHPSLVIDLSALPRGIYVLKIYTDKKIIIKKIVLK